MITQHAQLPAVLAARRYRALQAFLARLAAVLLTGLLSLSAQGQTVRIQEPWVRATVPGQLATGAFMKLTASNAARLVQASSPVAGLVEIHEMRMDRDVMRMAAITGLDLPAGRAVELKPGSYHVMLMQLKEQIREGDAVPLALTFQLPDGRKEIVEIKAQGRALQQPSRHSH